MNVLHWRKHSIYESWKSEVWYQTPHHAELMSQRHRSWNLLHFLFQCEAEKDSLCFKYLDSSFPSWTHSHVPVSLYCHMIHAMNNLASSFTAIMKNSSEIYLILCVRKKRDGIREGIRSFHELLWFLSQIVYLSLWITVLFSTPLFFRLSGFPLLRTWML